MTQIIEVVISPRGEIRVESRGFASSSCQQATLFLEQSLGVRKSEVLTAEYYSQAAGQLAHFSQEGGTS